MARKYYFYSMITFLLIPAALLSGGRIYNFINPEIAVHTGNYALYYRLLDLVRYAAMMGMLLGSIGLWILTCFFLLKSKHQSNWWLLLAVFGPCGFIVMTILKDNTDELSDLYRRFVRRINILLRIVYELCAVYVIWNLSYQLVVLKRNIMIRHDAAATGVSMAQIINQQNASGGMWAFSEGMETMYLVVLIYLLLPICFNLAGQLYKLLRIGHC